MATNGTVSTVAVSAVNNTISISVAGKPNPRDSRDHDPGCHFQVHS